MTGPHAHALGTAAANTSRWLGQMRQRAFRTAPSDRGAVVLKHQRIYILPTRRGAMFLATLLMMLLTSLNYALSLGFVVVFLLAGLAATALMHTFRNLAGVEIRPLAAGEAFAGGHLPFTLALSGGATRRDALRVATRDGVEVVAHVPAHGVVPVTLAVPVPTRGRTSLGRITVSTDFPLGIWRAWAYVHFPLAGLVYPSPEPGAPPMPVGPGREDPTGSGKEGEADLAGLREYQVGDPLQRVAWKAVARGVGWHTKQFDGAASNGPAVLDWYSLPASLGIEARLSRLTAWVLAAERIAAPFALSIPGHSLGVGQGRDQRRSALTSLALFQDPEEPR
jgi:uncharacterized protein (DUF58 family)